MTCRGCAIRSSFVNGQRRAALPTTWCRRPPSGDTVQGTRHFDNDILPAVKVGAFGALGWHPVARSNSRRRRGGRRGRLGELGSPVPTAGRRGHLLPC